MGKLERITIALPEELAARLRAAVENGEYATESEVISEALRGWGDEQDRKNAAMAKMRDMVMDAREGPFLDGPTALAELRTKYRVQRG